MIKIVTSILGGGLLLSACTNTNSNKIEENSSANLEDFNLIGKKAILEYPEFKAEVNYLSDSSLHWKTTTPDGKIAEGDEKVFYKKLNNSQFFLNWVEKDGLSISQVIDAKAKKVTAFGTFADEKSPRGKRSSMVLEGSFTFEK